MTSDYMKKERNVTVCSVCCWGFLLLFALVGITMDAPPGAEASLVLSYAIMRLMMLLLLLVAIYKTLKGIAKLYKLS